jgi:hypothetical protein
VSTTDGSDPSTTDGSDPSTTDGSDPSTTEHELPEPDPTEPSTPEAAPEPASSAPAEVPDPSVVKSPPDELSWIVTRHRERLTTAGIHSLAQLLDQTRCPSRRRSLAADLDLSTSILLQWASITSLLRMEELDVNMATRLCALGVDGPPCLAQQRPEVLRARLHDRQGDLNLPGLDGLQSLIDSAAAYERVVWY